MNWAAPAKQLSGDHNLIKLEKIRKHHLWEFRINLQFSHVLLLSRNTFCAYKLGKKDLLTNLLTLCISKQTALLYSNKCEEFKQIQIDLHVSIYIFYIGKRSKA